MLWPKKIHARSLITKKKFRWLENSPPNNFSNGPSLTWCNLKELTTKSAVSTCQRSLACACPVVGYIDHVIHWRVHFSFVLGSVSHFLPLPPPPRLCWFFSPLMFSVWQVPVPFLSCGGSWLGCAVVPVMGALFQSRGWKPWLGFKRRAIAEPNSIHRL